MERCGTQRNGSGWGGLFQGDQQMWFWTFWTVLG